MRPFVHCPLKHVGQVLFVGTAEVEFTISPCSQSTSESGIRL